MTIQFEEEEEEEKEADEEADEEEEAEEEEEEEQLCAGPAVSKEAKREAAVLLRQASHVWRITRGRV